MIYSAIFLYNNILLFFCFTEKNFTGKKIHRIIFRRQLLRRYKISPHVTFCSRKTIVLLEIRIFRKKTIKILENS
jgi:hypothetical protein